MTPLAYQVVKELTLPLKRRTFDDRIGLLSRMSDIHCFELTDVQDATESLAGDIIRRPGSADVLAFLPAPKTWLEWKNDGCRVGLLLEDTKMGMARVSMAFADGDGAPCSCAEDLITLHETVLPEPGAIAPPGLVRRLYHPGLIYAALALINTPRVIGRRQHMPHRGLERDLVRAKKTVGKFPLHAWTEIRLAITAPRDSGGDPAVEAHYTGDRALHFCRAHLRIRLGKLEIVSSHWRGDAALGIKQSRYILAA